MFSLPKHLIDKIFLSTLPFKKIDGETSYFLAICFFVQNPKLFHINLTNLVCFYIPYCQSVTGGNTFSAIKFS